MLYGDIYLYIAQYLTPYETKQLAMSCKTASVLRVSKCRKRLEYNVECRPYYPQKYIKEISKRESRRYEADYIKETIFFKGLEVGYIKKFEYIDQWYFCYNGKIDKSEGVTALFLKKLGFYYLYPCTEKEIFCGYQPLHKYYYLKELAIYDFLTFCKWMINE